MRMRVNLDGRVGGHGDGRVGGYERGPVQVHQQVRQHSVIPLEQCFYTNSFLTFYSFISTITQGGRG